MTSDLRACGLSLGADVGGTFTDFVIVNRETGELQASKILTTPDDPAEAVLEGTRRCLAAAAHSHLEEFVHGTTLVINALVERKGACTVLITTFGMRDILEMRRQNRYNIYDLAQPFPEPLIPRPLRKGVHERVLSSGEVLQPLDEAEFRQCVRELRQQGVESVAIGFLNSYLNPCHEKRAGEILAQECPDISVSVSAEVNPEQGEYERFSTTAANAFVKPRMHRYLLKLDRELERMALSRPMMMFSSHGGIIPVHTAAELPVFLVESGPAGGALAAAHIASLLGKHDVVAVDMGGTTAKMCGARGGRVITRYEYEVARMSRFSPGSGLALRIPVVDIVETGAGGGSIARADDLGLLTVGPESAGAVPGPACYDRGGTRPTVTDGDVVLGRLEPGDFLGGRMPLNRRAAEEAIRKHLGVKLGVGVEEAAMGISDVVDESMAITASEYLRERGIDRRRVTMVAYGGMGPVHAVSLAERMEVEEVLIPPLPGVFSALGFLIAPHSLELTQTYHKLLGSCDFNHLIQTAEALAKRGRTLLNAAPGAPAEFTIGMRYRGQWHPIDVSFPDPVQVRWTSDLFEQRFLEAYARLYEQISEDVPVETVTVRVRVIESAGTLRLPQVPPATHEGTSLDEKRQVIFSSGYGRPVVVTAPKLRREQLPLDFTAPGPLIVVEEHTSTVVPQGWELKVQAFGILGLRRI